MSHTLSYNEIHSIPAGRIMNTFIQEYVLSDHPTRWSNAQQKELVCHWFEEHPRSCAEDDGGYCSADGLTNYSEDISRAMSIANFLKTTPLSTRSEVGIHWASFSTVPFRDSNYAWKRVWASGETLALAICRAALLATI